VLLDLEKQRLDVLFVLVVVGVDRGMAYEVGCGGDLTVGRCFVIEAKSYGIEVPGTMCQYLSMIERCADDLTARYQANEAEGRIHSLACGLGQRWVSAARRSLWAMPERRETTLQREKVMSKPYLALRFLVIRTMTWGQDCRSKGRSAIDTKNARTAGTPMPYSATCNVIAQSELGPVLRFCDAGTSLWSQEQVAYVGPVI
jgi:hypothetical protein